MSSFIKIGLGVAIAVVFPFMVGLGIEAFYPSPKDTYQKCDYLVSAQERKGEADPRTENPAYRKCFDEAENTTKIYNRNLFAITSTIGFVTIAAGALLFGAALLSTTVGPVAPGLVFGGVITILYGVARGMSAIDMKWLFMEMVAILIGLILVTMRYIKKGKET